MPRDITNPKLLWLKAALLLMAGMASAALLLLDSPSLKTGCLLALVIWAFCRVYYFAFYVIEHYVDPTFKFSGLIAFLQYIRRNPKA